MSEPLGFIIPYGLSAINMFLYATCIGQCAQLAPLFVRGGWSDNVRDIALVAGVSAFYIALSIYWMATHGNLDPRTDSWGSQVLWQIYDMGIALILHLRLNYYRCRVCRIGTSFIRGLHLPGGGH